MQKKEVVVSYTIRWALYGVIAGFLLVTFKEMDFSNGALPLYYKDALIIVTKRYGIIGGLIGVVIGILTPKSIKSFVDELKKMFGLIIVGGILLSGLLSAISFLVYVNLIATDKQAAAFYYSIVFFFMLIVISELWSSVKLIDVSIFDFLLRKTKRKSKINRKMSLGKKDRGAKKMAEIDLKEKIQFVCPFCYVENKNSELVYRCGTCKTSHKIDKSLINQIRKFKEVTFLDKEEALFADKWPLNKSMLYRTGKHVSCGGVMKCICNNCGDDIPEGIFNGKDSRFAMAGNAKAGKSSYITSVFDELTTSANKYFLPGTTFDKSVHVETAAEQNQNREMLLNGGVRKTSLGKNPTSIFNIKKNRTNLNAFVDKKIGMKIETVVLFDCAGELYELANKNNENNIQYLEFSNGIVFIIDPYQLDKFKVDKYHDECEKYSPDTENSQSISDTLDKLAGVIRNVNGLSENKKISVPIAVVITKVDGPSIAQTLDDSLKNFYDNDVRVYNKEKYKTVSLKAKSLLSDLGEDIFITKLEQNFKKIHYFATSSYGLNYQPGDSSHEPFMVVEPLLWLLENKK